MNVPTTAIEMLTLSRVHAYPIDHRLIDGWL
jgi:hypothetical protein